MPKIITPSARGTRERRGEGGGAGRRNLGTRENRGAERTGGQEEQRDRGTGEQGDRGTSFKM